MASYLLTWNPATWHWDDYVSMAEQVGSGENVNIPWSAGGTKQIKDGDRLILLRQGIEPRGLIGTGWATGDWYEDVHFDQAKANEGITTTYVPMRLDSLVDVEAQPERVLFVETLERLIPALNTSIQRSGTQIPADLAIGLEQLWRYPERLKLERNDAFPDDIKRQDVLDAIRYYEQHGFPATFAESSDYDLVHRGVRYPPKAIAGLAARRARGRLMFSQEFRGGKGTPCFRLLTGNGFKIEPKQDAGGATAATESVEQLLTLGRRFWWVNQNQTFKAETSGGYIWSPKRKANGHRNPFYETMREVSPGDIILSFRGTRIPAIGVATSHAYEAAKPDEFGNAGANWQNTGWRVDVQYEMVAKPIRPKDHIDALRPLLPAKYAPLTDSGDGIQSVYLTELPADLFQKVMELTLEAGHAVGLPTEIKVPSDANRAREQDQRDESIERSVEEDPSLKTTEKEQIVLARRGQGQFKKNLAQVEPNCRVTRIAKIEYLIASHMKPWRACDNRERLDGANGLLLAPHVDFLFDRGLISFADDGEILISPTVDMDTLQRLHIPTDGSLPNRTFSDQQKPFLEYHRREVFLKADRGD